MNTYDIQIASFSYKKWIECIKLWLWNFIFYQAKTFRGILSKFGIGRSKTQWEKLFLEKAYEVHSYLNHLYYNYFDRFFYGQWFYSNYLTILTHWIKGGWASKLKTYQYLLVVIEYFDRMKRVWFMGL